MSTKADERRKQVFLGDLPEDFLRVAPSTSGQLTQPQPQTDEQAAWALQQQLNSMPAGYYSGFAPPNTRGRLTVTIASAKLAKNYGLVRMDPYCRLRVGNTVFETPTDSSGGKSPKWNRTVQCYLPNGVDTIYLEIYDEHAFTTDERVAWGSVALPEAIFSMETIDEWYPLSGKEGEGKEGMVNLVVAFAPVDAPQVNYVPIHHPGVVFVQQTQPPAVQPQPPQGYVNPNIPVDEVGPPAGPLFTEEDVKELGEMFPNIDPEVVSSVLDEKRGNKDAAINALLSIGSE